MEKIRVHIVDDSKEFIESLKHLFRNDKEIEISGYSLGGEELFKHFEPEKFDVMFMDIKMPEMNGLQLIDRILTDYPFLKIIVLSIYRDEEKIYDAVGKGAMGYIKKDSSKREILTALKHVMNGEMYFPVKV